jgi:hypothetical protein
LRRRTSAHFILYLVSSVVPICVEELAPFHHGCALFSTATNVLQWGGRLQVNKDTRSLFVLSRTQKKIRETAEGQGRNKTEPAHNVGWRASSWIEATSSWTRCSVIGRAPHASRAWPMLHKLTVRSNINHLRVNINTACTSSIQPSSSGAFQNGFPTALCKNIH